VIWQVHNGQVSTVLPPTAKVPGEIDDPGRVTSEFLGSALIASDGADFAFYAGFEVGRTIRGVSNHVGIFTIINGVLSKVLDERTPVPNHPTGLGTALNPLGWFSPIGFQSGTTLIWDQSFPRDLYAHRSGTFRVVADDKNVIWPLWVAGDKVLLRAASEGTIVFVYDIQTGTATPILDVSTQLDGKSIYDVTDGSIDGENIALKIEFRDGTVGIYRGAPSQTPDIVASNITINNGAVLCEWEIKDTDLTSDTSLSLYWSANDIFDASDTLARSQPITANGRNLGKYSASIPIDGSNAPTGTRFLLLVADPQGAIDETDESNNVRAVVFAGPEIISVSPVLRGNPPIELGEPYRINVRVVQNGVSTTPEFVTVSVTEQAVNLLTLELGDKLIGFPKNPSRLGYTEQEESLTPGVPKNLPFPHAFIEDYHHSWNWVGDELDDGCIDIFKLVQDGTSELGQIVGDVTKLWHDGLITAAQAALQIREQSLQRGLLVTEGTYRYVVEAIDDAGRTDVSSALTVTVEVPEYKQSELDTYFTASLLQSAAFGLGVFPPKLPLLAIGAMALGVACGAYHIAVDPDPNFAQLATFQPILVPAIDGLDDSTGTRIAEHLTKALSYKRAAGTSFGRFEGAKAAGDQVWIVRQLAAAEAFQQQSIQHLIAASALMPNLVSELEAAGVTLTREQLQNAKASLLAEGFSTFEQDILSSLGFTASEIDTAGIVTANLLDYVPLQWKESHTKGMEGLVDLARNVHNYAEDRLAILLAAPPSVSSLPIIPNPRESSLSDITIAFTKPITGLDLSDLTLTRADGDNLISGAQILSSTDGQNWVLSNLASVTAPTGRYELRLPAAGSGIIDATGQPLVNDLSVSWLVGIAGDYNLSGTVDAADFVVWRNSLGSVVPAYSSADGDGNGIIDQNDYGVWRANFGRTLTATAAVSGAIPEGRTDSPAAFNASAQAEAQAKEAAIARMHDTDAYFTKTVGRQSPRSTNSSHRSTVDRPFQRAAFAERQDASLLAWFSMRAATAQLTKVGANVGAMERIEPVADFDATERAFEAIGATNSLLHMPSGL
jgi:hypothetical protein